MRHMGADRSEVAQPMHNLDVGLRMFWSRSQPGTEVCDQLARRERCPTPVVDAHAVRRGWGQLVPVERGVAPVMTDHVRA